MRISDWSSDVCSSDLAGQGVGGGAVALALEVLLRHVGHDRRAGEHRLGDVLATHLDRVEFGGRRRRGRLFGGGCLWFGMCLLGQRTGGREQGRGRQAQACAFGGELHGWQPFVGLWWSDKSIPRRFRRREGESRVGGGWC